MRQQFARRHPSILSLLATLLAVLLVSVIPAGPTGAETAPAAAAAPVYVSQMTVENQAEPLGIGTLQPRLSWQLASGVTGERQTAYRVIVSSTEALATAGDGDVWDSGKVESDQSVNVLYDGSALASATRYYWRVQVWDADGLASPWSGVSWWETGLLDRSDWDAHWIGWPTSNLTWSDFSLEMDFTLEREAAGIVFRAQNPSSFYMWQINEIESDKVLLRPHIQTNGSWQVLTPVDLSNVIPRSEVHDPHHIKIQADGDTITTWIDGTQVDSRVVTTYSEGKIGFRSVSSESALYDNLVVRSLDGEELFSDDFSTVPDEWFAGARIVDGQLRNNGEVQLAGGTQPGVTSLRDEFTVDKPVARARLYVSALGAYEAHINGRRVGRDRLTPGWTDFDTRVQYQTYDVTNMVHPGGNAVGALLGLGWLDGMASGSHGVHPWLLAQLRVDYADGTSQLVTTDDSWRISTSPILSASIYDGERYDARLEEPGWDQSGFDGTDWRAVEVDDDIDSRLVSQVGPPIRVTEEIHPVEITEPRDGVYVFDMGQNMVGWNRLRVSGPAGTTVTMRHAEVLNPDGTIYTANLRGADATDTFVLAGTGDTEVYEPRFTYHGYRYVELTGLPSEPTTDTITGLVAHAAAPDTGSFHTSSDVINQVQHNIAWGERGNFMAAPTDCPQRDERLGWTGDINIFAATSTFNMGVDGFLNGFVDAMDDVQSPEGAFTDFAPCAGCGGGTAGWGDAGVTVPWTLWQRYDDVRVIEDHYDAMTDWIAYLRQTSRPDLIRDHPTYGDWLNVNDPTPQDVVSTAFFAYSTKLVAQMAEATGRTDDAAGYRDLYQRISAAFVDEFVTEGGARIKGDSQTAYVLALSMGLLPDQMRQAAADRLVEKIESRDGHLSVGFLGVEKLLPVLTETGHLDVAYQLLNQRTFPSWGYMSEQGATTVWERWDGIRPDGSFNDPGMNSFNHYGLGSVGDWMYQVVGGIRPDPEQPGYKHVVLRPQPGGGLTSATTSYETPYGLVRSDWTLDDDGFTLHATVPVNATATVWVPAASRDEVTGAPNATFLRMEDGAAIFAAGSGSYTFNAAR